VVGGHDEVKAGRRGGRGHLGDPPPAVGMHCVRVQIAAIPTRSTVETAGWVDVPSRPQRRLHAPGQRNLGVPVHAQRVEHHRPECQRPASGIDRTRQVAGRRVDRGQHESCTGSARPAPKPLGVAEFVARGPVEAQIEHIAADAEQRELVMRRADVDSLGPHRYVERHIGPLVDAEAESATERELDAGVRPQGRHDVSSSGWPHHRRRAPKRRLHRREQQ